MIVCCRSEHDRLLHGQTFLNNSSATADPVDGRIPEQHLRLDVTI